MNRVKFDNVHGEEKYLYMDISLLILGQPDREPWTSHRILELTNLIIFLAQLNYNFIRIALVCNLAC